MTTAQEIIQNIRRFGLTQAEIAEHTGLNQPSISKIERGDVSDVRATTYLALSNLLNKLKNNSEFYSETA